MSLLTATNITKKYANHTALDGVSISVNEQSIFGLLGPNGAGKTTLIRIINQIIAPDKGELFFRDVILNPAHTSLIGYMPEERGLYKKMKVGEQALYLAQLKGLNKNDALKKLKYWFEKFEIQNWWDKKTEELSKGMQQKIQFIVTVLHDPKLLIFDEPFSGFDPINVDIVKKEILRLRDEGATIIFSTHNMESVEEICDHIALINKSKTILEGKVKDIKKAYKPNIFEASISGFKGNLEEILKNNFELIEKYNDDEYTKIKVKISSSSSPNDLIQAIIPHAMIYSFNEIMPTMNEIFIKTVTKNN